MAVTIKYEFPFFVSGRHGFIPSGVVIVLCLDTFPLSLNCCSTHNAFSRHYCIVCSLLLHSGAVLADSGDETPLFSIPRSLVPAQVAILGD